MNFSLDATSAPRISCALSRLLSRRGGFIVGRSVTTHHRWLRTSPMSLAKQRGAKAIYVAGSARDLPADVQIWLSRADNRATASNSIHDLLAQLVNGARPAAVLVHMGMVDWGEMEFFDLVHRLSPETNLYVTGQEHHRDKVDTACEHLAERFDGSLLDEDLKRPGRMAASSGLSDLVAGSAGSKSACPAVPSRREADVARDDDHGPAVPPAAAATPNVRLVSTEPRLRDTGVPPMPFPWRPAEDRPQRTPPGRIPPGSEKTAEQASNLNEMASGSGVDQPRAHRHTVHLTQEELEALIGKPLSLGSGSDELFIGHNSKENRESSTRASHTQEDSR